MFKLDSQKVVNNNPSANAWHNLTLSVYIKNKELIEASTSAWFDNNRDDQLLELENKLRKERVNIFLIAKSSGVTEINIDGKKIPISYINDKRVDKTVDHPQYELDYKFINDTQWLSGAQLVDRIATGNSLNPRLLLLLLEYQSNWVYGEPEMEGLDYPMGYQSPDYKGLYRQLIWAAMQISVGYYGWRDGKLAALTFPDGSTMRLAPNLNAGSVALQYLFSKLYNPEEWYEILYGPDSIIVFSTLMFDDPWLFAQISAPMIPWGLQQPQLELPFLPGTRWNFTGGPHGAWERYGSMGGLDFSPAGVSGCKKSEEWVTAAAPGVVVRSEEGVVMLDLDGDGSEYTGWNLLHLHIASDGRVDNGIYLETDGRIGHPSCERGFASGSHVHIARKYNGEWIAADGPLPFVLGGWQVHAGESAYRGTLTRDGQVIQTSHHGAQESLIIR